jgi:hypothetical protein
MYGGVDKWIVKRNYAIRRSVGVGLGSNTRHVIKVEMGWTCAGYRLRRYGWNSVRKSH